MQANFRFLTPNTDGTVIDICIKASDLNAAFNKFVSEHPRVTKEFAVWRGQSLCARILHERNPGNREIRATIIEFNPVEPSLSNRFACGD
jgi:hypothetical protein